MATETKFPDGIVSSLNYSTLNLGDIDDDPDADDSVYGTWDGNGNTDCLVDFPTPTGDPTVGADLQEFRVKIRRDSGSGTNTTSWSLELWENGVQVRALATGSDPSTAGVVVSGTWNANEIATADGSLVQCKLLQTAGGGGNPSARRGIEVGAFKWDVVYDSGTTYNEQGSGPAVSAGTATPVNHVKAEQGSGPAVGAGTATPVNHVKVEAGSGPAVSAGAASEIQTHVQQGSGPAVGAGGATDTGVWVNQGSGPAVTTGEALDAVIWATLQGSGPAITAGAATEFISYDEVGSGPAVTAGGASESQVMLNSGSGPGATAGGATSAWTTFVQGTGAAVSAGLATDAMIMVQTGSGPTIAAGGATDAQTFLEQAAGNALAAGGGTDAQVHVPSPSGAAVVAGAATDEHVQVAPPGLPAFTADGYGLVTYDTDGSSRAMLTVSLSSEQALVKGAGSLQTHQIEGIANG